MSKHTPSKNTTREPTVEQQQVLDRIAVQRERLNTRRAERAHRLAALQQQAPGMEQDAPLALRVALFARQHPAAMAALAGVALVAGPRRLLRWLGVAVPLVMRMRGR